MSAASQAGMPTPIKPLDITNAEHSEAVIAAASAIRVRRNPASFAALCLIDSIQREHAAKLQARSFQTWDEEDLSPMEIESLRERSDLMQRPAG